MTGEAFERPHARPLELAAVPRLYDPDTGEVLGWERLNHDPERCPMECCFRFPRCSGGVCRCAPCRCPECVARLAAAVVG